MVPEEATERTRGDGSGSEEGELVESPGGPHHATQTRRPEISHAARLALAEGYAPTPPLAEDYTRLPAEERWALPEAANEAREERFTAAEAADGRRAGDWRWAGQDSGGAEGPQKRLRDPD